MLLRQRSLFFLILTIAFGALVFISQSARADSVSKPWALIGWCAGTANGNVITWHVTGNYGVPPYQFSWLPGDAGFTAAGATSSDVTLIYQNIGTYHATVHISDSGSTDTVVATCSASVTSMTETPDGTPIANLSVDEHVTPAFARPGDMVSFNIVVTGNGPATSTQVGIQSVLSPGLNFVNATTTYGVFVPSMKKWFPGDLGVGQVASFTVVATIDPSATVGSILSNVVNVSESTSTANYDQHPTADASVTVVGDGAASSSSVSVGGPVGMNEVLTLATTTLVDASATDLDVSSTATSSDPFSIATTTLENIPVVQPAALNIVMVQAGSRQAIKTELTYLFARLQALLAQLH